MANVLLLSGLTTGRSSATVEVRLLHFWEARNVRHDGELMGVDMLLLDSQVMFRSTFVLYLPTEFSDHLRLIESML